MAKTPGADRWKATGHTLGSGGQGQVRVVEPIDGAPFPPTQYAMKVLSNTKSRQALTRFRQEISAIKSLDDPRIVRIVDFDDGADPYYVMPRYDKSDLSDVIYGPTSPYRGNAIASCELIAECAEALQIAHAASIVHRDIKPGNILIDKEGKHPVIVDFGCCHIMEDRTRVTLTDEGVGTQNFMAPECESGAGGTPTARSDVYSLGKLLWSLVTGSQPFARERPGFTTLSVSTLLPDRPMAWFITDLLELSVRNRPEKRAKDAQAFADACRKTVLQISQGLKPLELVQKQCPVCGSTNIVDGRAPAKADGFDINVRAFIPQEPSSEARFCKRCGFVVLRDARILRTYADRIHAAD